MANLEGLAAQVRNEGYMDTYIFEDPGMRETDMNGVISRVNRTFSDRLYRRNIERAGRTNWNGIKVPDALKKIADFLGSLQMDHDIR